MKGICKMIKFLIEPGYDVKPPQREAGNAGIDFFVPKLNSVFEQAFDAKNDPIKACIKKNEDGTAYIIVAPHGDANIPSGIHSYIAPNIGLIAVNKSGIASKKKFVTGACLVDPNYQGIIHCHVMNTSDKPQIIDFETKIVQFVPYEFDNSEIEVFSNITKEEFYSDMTFNNRGDGAFGSTTLTN
jgi:dUTPase